MQTNLTQTKLDALLARRDGERVELADAKTPGLRIRIGQTGAAWSVLVRTPDGKRTRVGLGPYPALGIADARSKALAVMKQVSDGVDPNAEKRRLKDEAARPKLTFAEAVEMYADARLRSQRDGEYARRALLNVFSDLCPKPVEAVTRGELARAVQAHASRAPIAANRALARVRPMFKWLVERDLAPYPSAAEGIAMPAKEHARERALSSDELADLLRVLDGEAYPLGPLVQVMVYTAARRSEVAAMRQDELDLAAGVWTIPAERSKNGSPLRVPLAAQTVEALMAAAQEAERLQETLSESLSGLEGAPSPTGLIFTTTGSTPFSGFSKAKARLDARLNKLREAEGRKPMEPWRLHDLRRTFATIAADELGIAPDVCDRMLNHVAASTSSTVQRVYQRAELFEPRKRAAEAWAAYLDRLLDGAAEPSNVIALNGRKQESET